MAAAASAKAGEAYNDAISAEEDVNLDENGDLQLSESVEEEPDIAVEDVSETDTESGEGDESGDSEYEGDGG